MTPFRRKILARIAAGERVRPTGKDGMALSWLRGQRYIRTRWIDESTPVVVITVAGRKAMGLPRHAAVRTAQAQDRAHVDPGFADALARGCGAPTPGDG